MAPLNQIMRSVISLRGLFTLILLVSLVLTLIPPIRKSVKEHFFPDEKEILAQISVNLFNDKNLLKILKVRSKNGLALEIYPHPSQPENQFKPITLLIGDSHDAFFQFNGTAENLFAKDFDKDGVLEIVAPSFDANWETHLNIFRYNPITKSFELTNKDSFNLKSL